MLNKVLKRVLIFCCLFLIGYSIPLQAKVLGGRWPRKVLYYKVDSSIINLSGYQSQLSNFVTDDVIKKGEYILFLNVVEDKGEIYYVNNSLNNLYKYEDKKYVNVAVNREEYEAEAKIKAKEGVTTVKGDEIANSVIPLLEFTDEELLNIEK